MISLKYCCENWEEARDTHVEFMAKRISERIEYYERLLDCIEVGRQHPQDFDLHLSNEFSLSTSGEHSTFRSRANQLFISKNVIGKNADYELLLTSPSLRAELANLSNIKGGLTALLAALKHLLGLEFKEPYQTSYLYISQLTTDTAQINFLYDTLLDYDDFSQLDLNEKWGPYQLLEKLKVSVCPYCNRQYTTSLHAKGKKLTRPDIDHFLPKWTNPILQVSFFNLVPSCQVCNRGLKNRQSTSYSTHLNPYEDNPKHSYMRFNYLPVNMAGAQGLSRNFDIVVQSNSKNPVIQTKVAGNKEMFQLEPVYNTHKDVVQDLIWKSENWDASHLSMINASFSNLHISKADAFRLVFGNYYDEKDFTRRPLAKMTKDIAVRLGLDKLI